MDQLNDKTLNLTTTWDGNTKGKGNIKAPFLNTDIAIPEQYGGTGEGAEPQELLIASATACFTMMLTSMLQMKKVSVENINIDTKSVNADGDFSVVHDTEITLTENATDEQVQTANELIIAADEQCNVGNLLRKAGIKIEAKGLTQIA